MQFFHYMPTRVYFGRGTFDRLPELIRPWGDAVFVITTRKALRIAGLLDRLEEMLKNEGFTFHIYSLEDLSKSFRIINRVASLVREMKADVLLAVGGGSVIDTTKGVAVAAMHSRGLVEDYLGKGKIRIAMPIIAVPTTAGSGGEVTHYALLSDGGKWDVLVSSKIQPKVAVVDPETTLTLDMQNTIHSGFDALSHLVEGFFSARANPVIEPLALRGMWLCKKSFERAVYRGDDIEARTDMSLAALLGGMVINDAGVGLTHFLGFPISEDLGLPHGLVNAMLLPHVVEKNLQRGGPVLLGKYDMIKRRLGVDIVDFIWRLRESFGIPASLVEMGADAGLDITGWTERAMRRVEAYKKALPYVPTPEEVSEIYARVLRG